MLRIDQLSHAIAGRPLLEACSVVIPAGHKVGLVGRNGTGKTTLFRLITGDIEPDSGTLSVPRGARIGTVAQEAPGGPTSLIDTVLAADTERVALLDEAERASDPARIAEIQLRLADISAHTAEARASQILAGLGFDAEAQRRPTSAFSGGWRMRVALAGVLFAEPDLLLLDEPTNYLDLEGTIWLETYLARYPHTVIVISHDRGLLNRAVDHILHLSRKTLTLYRGGFDQFDAEYRARAALDAAAARKQEAARAHMQAFVDRFRYKASKARQAQSRLKMLARLQPIASMSEGTVRGFRFPEPDALSPPIIALDRASAGYDGKPVLHGLDLRIDPDDRIALLGANGQGKSTLAKLIAGRLAPIDGARVTSNRLRIGFFAQHQAEDLDTGATPLDVLSRAMPGKPPAAVRATLADGGIGADIATTRIGELSGGQKSRMAMLLATLDRPHLVILDEPTNHLDIDSRAALIEALAGFGGAVILISHDPHLVECVADSLWLVDGGRVRRFDGDMSDYRDYLLARGATTAPSRQASAERKAETPPRPRSPSRQDHARLRAELRRAEDRVATIEDLLARIDERLADPDLHGQSDAPQRLAQLNAKRSEAARALVRAEELWEAAQRDLDRAADT